MQWYASGKPELKELDISEAMVTKYVESGLQPLYFVVDSIGEMTKTMM